MRAIPILAILARGLEGLAIVDYVVEQDERNAESIKKAGGPNTVHVLARSQSAGNAAKSMSKFVGSNWSNYVDVHVVETVRHDGSKYPNPRQGRSA
jgi:hypothetical protein